MYRASSTARCRPQLQWKMHHASSTAHAVAHSRSGRCTVHLPLPMLSPAVAVEYAPCIFHCPCCRPSSQWKMHCASSTANVVARSGSGRCTMHLPLQMLSPIIAVEDAPCTFHCPCCRPPWQWKMHHASSTAHAVAHSRSGRCTMHLPLPMLSPAVAVEDAPCIFHCPCCRP